MACDLWGESPLDENEGLKERSVPTVTPIDKRLDEDSCGKVTNRGKEARVPERHRYQIPLNQELRRVCGE